MGNTTREEMILYERFGENYDIIVEKMCKEEKVKLKEEVSKATPKDAMELLEKSQSNSGDTLKVSGISITTSMSEDRNIMGDKQSTGQTLEKPDSFPIDVHTPTQ